MGLRVEAVDGPQAALALLSRDGEPQVRFSLMISDLQMPVLDVFGLAAEVRKIADYRDMPILVLSSSAQSSEWARCGELGIVGYLTKPVQPSELFDAILNALSVPGAESGSAEATVPMSSAGAKAPRTILLAEDNAVNRKLVTRLLEKHGYHVVVTENGRAALEALQRHSVDAVLMDVQMPVMDGLEAIRIIRENEQKTGSRLPIIALTAHAMKGDRERCLGVGADDYLTKPIRTADLLVALARIENVAFAISEDVTATTDLPISPAWDMAAALARLEDDSQLVEELVHLFLEGCPMAMEEMRDALEAGDTVLLERLAHTMKGSSANIAATATSRAALALELEARGGDLRKARERVDILQAEIHRLLPELEAIIGKSVR